MREQAINDHCVYSNDDHGSEDDVDQQPWDGHALLCGEWVVETIVVEREGLVEWRDLVDEGEEPDEETTHVQRALARVHWE